MKWQLSLKYIKEKVKEELQYFSLSPEEQANFLENHNRLRLARSKYLQLNNISKVIELSKKLNDYKAVFHYQIKNKDFNQAIQTAELYQLYKLGAPFCEKQGHIIKAAYMYAHFDLLKAASLYKQEHLWTKAFDCYIQLGQYYRALDCVEQITDAETKKTCYKVIENKADELYNKEDYDSSLKLFVRLQVWNKALEAAKHLQNLEIQKLIYEKLANHALKENQLEEAAHFYEYNNISKAVQLYIQLEDISRATQLLESIGKNEEAIHLCLKYDYPEQAYMIASKHNLLKTLLPYYLDNNDVTKVSAIYEQLHEYEEGARFFMEQKQFEIGVELAKKIANPAIAAELLEAMEYSESAAHYYLLAANEKKCKDCLKKAGYNPAEIENYFFVKNYPNS